MGERLLVAVAAIIPVVALAFEHVGNVRISERHHSHHDTYVVPVEFTRSLVLAMTFMAVLGLLVAWLCERDVFLADAVVVLGFFDAFLVTCFVMWSLRYDQIERLEWTGMRVGSGFRNLEVWVDGRRAVTLLGIVDIEQIVMSIDRFDLLTKTG